MTSAARDSLLHFAKVELRDSMVDTWLFCRVQKSRRKGMNAIVKMGGNPSEIGAQSPEDS